MTISPAIQDSAQGTAKWLYNLEADNSTVNQSIGRTNGRAHAKPKREVLFLFYA